jgi:lysyl-tRNA synthetase class 2
MSRASNLYTRAEMFFKAREFFRERKIVEVDCPILTQAASVDAHIDLITANNGKELRYMHSSPEYGMKRLLAEGLGDIYQLSHVFREGEVGKKHNPEFTLAEWYRLHFSFDEMILETIDFISLFLGKLPVQKNTYHQTFLQFTGLNCFKACVDDLIQYLKDQKIPSYDAIIKDGKDSLLNLILAEKIEPYLGESGLYVLTHYPATQAALAKKAMMDGEEVSLRFEIYYHGMELANGYFELTDAKEQLKRFHEANQKRKELQKKELPIDEAFLKALEKGLPPCCGVAVGFDRLMMLKTDATHISEVIPFDWEKA